MAGGHLSDIQLMAALFQSLSNTLQPDSQLAIVTASSISQITDRDIGHNGCQSLFNKVKYFKDSQINKALYWHIPSFYTQRIGGIVLPSTGSHWF